MEESRKESRQSMGGLRRGGVLGGVLVATLLLGSFISFANTSPRGSIAVCPSPTVLGTSGPNVLKGTAGDDVIQGLGGPDEIAGRGGQDVLCGGKGDDVIKAGQPSPTPLPGSVLLGGAGDDQLVGGGRGETLIGGSGQDSLSGGGMNDDLAGDGIGSSNQTTSPDSLKGGWGSDRCVQDDQDDITNCGTWVP